MRVENFIKQYVARHTEPEQKFCPVLYQYWHGTKNGVRYTKVHNSFTGKIELFNGRIPYGQNYLTPRSYRYEGTYLKEVRDGLLEISRIEITDTCRGKDGIPKVWKYQTYTYYNIPNRIFLDRETLKAYDVNGNEVCSDAQGKFYNKEIAKYLGRLCVGGRIVSEDSQEIWQTFTGVKSINVRWGEGDMRWPWHWKEWYTHAAKRPVNQTTKQFEEIEERLSEHNYSNITIEFEIIEGYGLFRCYKQNREKVRVFIDKKGKPTVRVFNGKNWNTTSNDFRNEYYVYSGVNIDTIGFEYMENIECLRYILPIIDADKPNVLLWRIISTLRHPILEKLAKAGYPEIAKDLATGNEIVANIRNCFGVKKVNEKATIYKCLGLNKASLQFIEENIKSNDVNKYSWRSSIRWRDYSSVIPSIKYILGEDLSSLSKDKFDMYWAGCKELDCKSIKYAINPNAAYRWHCQRDIEPLTDEEKRIIDKIFKYELKETGIVRAYKDAVSQMRSLRHKPDINLMDFRNKEDIIQMHDNIVALYNAEQEERRRLYAMRDEERRKEFQKKFEKLQEDRISLYETENDEYKIVVPKDLTELTTEGSQLHHCVGGYLDRHANGDTNIVFLRKKNTPNTPFYTIEVSNSGNIIQIHGKYNCWLGNNPEVIAFVNKWINDRGFRCSKNILLDTATGYSASGKLVSESYLVA